MAPDARTRRYVNETNTVGNRLLKAICNYPLNAIASSDRLSFLPETREACLLQRRAQGKPVTRDLYPEHWDEEEEVEKLKERYKEWLAGEDRDLRQRSTSSRGTHDADGEHDGAMPDQRAESQDSAEHRPDVGEKDANEHTRTTLDGETSSSSNFGGRRDSCKTSPHPHAEMLGPGTSNDVADNSKPSKKESGDVKIEIVIEFSEIASFSNFITSSAQHSWFRDRSMKSLGELAPSSRPFTWIAGRGWAEALLPDKTIKAESKELPIKRECQDADLFTAKKIKIKTEPQ